MTAALRDLVVLDAVTPNRRPLRFHLNGDDELTGGVGGWEDVPRPRRRATSEWVGSPVFQLAVPLITSGIDAGRPGRDVSVEPKLRALVALGQPTVKTGEPPILKVTGPLRVPSPKTRWVLVDIEWGAQIRNSRGQRIQQEMTVILREYVRGDILRGPAAAARARKGL